MPERETLRRARRDQRQGKSASTQAGEFIREEIHHIREGKHGARSTEQAIAIGLSKARRAGVPLKPPRPGTTSEATRRQAERDTRKGRSHTRPSARRSRAVTEKLEHEGHRAASPAALSEHARRVARERGPKARHESAIKAARTRVRSEHRRGTKKAARKRETWR